MEFLEKAYQFIYSAYGASATIAIIIEFTLRVIPSKKPLSTLYVVADVAKKVGAILTKFGELADKVLPQRLK